MRTTAAALVHAAATAAARLTYRRQELVVVALLAVSVLGGFAVEAWRRRAPAFLEWLEAERPRLAPAARARPGSRPATAAPKTGAGPSREPAPDRAGRPSASPTREAPLDLNRATAADLVRLPGVGPRLAGRILAHRETLGGRFASADDLAAVPGLGERKAGRLRPLVAVDAGAPP